MGYKPSMLLFSLRFFSHLLRQGIEQAPEREREGGQNALVVHMAWKVRTFFGWMGKALAVSEEQPTQVHTERRVVV
jgi:hypothetical protein